MKCFTKNSSASDIIKIGLILSAIISVLTLSSAISAAKEHNKEHSKENSALNSKPALGSLALKANATKGQVAFEAIGKPSFLKIKGQGVGPEGELTIGDKIQGTFRFKLDSLDTGISLRDDHMKNKYLEVAKHPTAEIKIESVEAFNPAQKESVGLSFKGQLTMHGVSQPVSGTVDTRKTEKGYAVTAQFEAKMTDFAIAIPSYAGIRVADVVKVSVQTELQ